MSNSLIEEKIKKLLRLSKSPNIHEAQLALERAFEIAAKNQVDIQSLDLGEELNTIVTEACKIGYRLSIVKRLALNLCVKFFNVNVVIAYPSAMIIGLDSDVKIAQYVFEFVSTSAEACVAEMSKQYSRSFTENRRRNFIAGWFYAIGKSLDDSKQHLLEQEQCLGLVLSNRKKQRDEKTDEIFPTTKISRSVAKPKRLDKNWLMVGYREGQKVQINKAVEESASTNQKKVSA